VFVTAILWMWLLFLFFLVLGLIAFRHKLAAVKGIEKVVVLGPVFAASSLAMFGAEHLTSAHFIMQGVPSWMPAHLFWAYFVGFALLATALSLSLQRYVGLSSLLTAIMIFLFVLTLHIPRVAANPKDRFAWAVVLRDSAFASGFLAYAGLTYENAKRWMVLVARIIFGVAILVFAVEHFLHPAFTPGVPLEKVTPSWFPLPQVWGYLTALVLLAGAVTLLINVKARTGAAWVGLVEALITTFLYTPILIAIIHNHGQTPELVEGLNYVGDTLLFAGVALLLAAAIPADARLSPTG
jgi:uncharacterized membrane protein